MPIADVWEHGADGEVLAAGDSHDDVIWAGPGHAQLHYGDKDIRNHKVGTCLYPRCFFLNFKLSWNVDSNTI